MEAVKSLGGNFVLRLLQALFAIFLLNFQSKGLSQSEFSALLFVTAIQALLMFLDFGESTRLVQLHLEGIEFQRNREEEVSALLVSFRKRSLKVFFVAMLNGLVACIFAKFAFKHFEINLNIDIEIAILFSSVLIFISWYVSRGLVALGEIRIWLTFQLIGMIAQTFFQYLISRSNNSLIFYLWNTGSGSLFFIFLCLTYYFIHANLKKIEVSPLQSTSFRFKDRFAVQSLQIFQVCYLVSLPILFARQFNNLNFAIFSIQLKIIFTFTAAIGSSLALNWRRSLTSASSLNPIKPRTNLTAELFIPWFGLLATVVILIPLNFGWSWVLNSEYKPKLVTWVLWPLVVSSQLLIWHYYYRLLALKKYAALNCGAVLQLSILLVFFWVKITNFTLAPVILLLPQISCAIFYFFTSKYENLF